MKKQLHFRALALLCAAFFVGESSAQSVTVDLSKESQKITGFGGINFTTWISDLTASQREIAFGNDNNQLGFSVLRIHVDELESNWSREVATVKAAKQHGCTVFASPWNPPSSMCEQKSGMKYHLKHDSYQAYTDHLNKFVKFMKDQGAPIDAISIQNEPDYASEWTGWTPTELVDFCKNYAGKINCKVIAPESFQYRKNYSDPIINDAAAWANVDVLGCHTYGTLVSDFAYQNYFNHSQGKELWMTEVYVPNSEANSNSRWPESLDVAVHMSNGMAVARFNAYVWWYIRRSYGPMNEDGSISKRGYMMAHFSKYVRPGYVRLDCTHNPTSNVYFTAYKNENDITLVIINKNTSAKTLNVSIPNNAVTSWERIVTTGSKNLAKESCNYSGTQFSVQLDAQSVVTLVGKGKNGMPKVTVTAPKEGTRFESPAAIEIKANATDENGQITKVEFYADDKLIGSSSNAPYTYTWDVEEIGKHTITVKATDNEGNVAAASTDVNVAQPKGPYKGTMVEIPGKIEAENFDEGGQGYGYSDNEEENQEKEYRPNEGVDITTTPDGGYAVGYTNTSEWLEYTVEVTETGDYTWYFNLASGSATSALHVECDGETIIPKINVEKTGEEWNNYKVVSGETKLTAGKHVIRIVIDNSYVNIDWLEFKSKNTTGSVVIESVKVAPHQGKYDVFSLSGKKLYSLNINSKEDAQSKLEKTLQPGIYVLSSGDDSFKIELK